ncbi:MAG: hypothetical protein Q6365_016180 [Candidatus Sigynarchaeota archaeon]
MRERSNGGEHAESRLVQAALDGWQQAKFDMYNPAVPDPVISFSNDYKEPFYIDVRDWTVHLNLAHSPALDEAGIREFTRSISHHELAHYTICPYDGITNGLMLQAAQRVLGPTHAPIACNIVSDLIIEQELSRRFKDLTAWRFTESVSKVARDMAGKELSLTWRLIVKAESLVTGQPVPEEVEHAADFKEVIADAKKIASLVGKNLRDMNAWPSLVASVSRILKKYVQQDFPVLVATVDPAPSTNRRDVPGSDDTFIEIPVDVLEQSGDVSKTSDKDNGRMNERTLKQGRCRRGRGKRGDVPRQEPEKNDTRILVELAKRSKNVGEFGGPAVAMGLLRVEHVLASWYRSRAAGLIQVTLMTRRDTGSMPITPVTWRLGDPVETLDPTLTLLNSPLIIPNFTTRKWEQVMQTGLVPEKNYPDFLIVIDSSGSMGWHPDSDHAKGEYDTALVAAFAAVHFARLKGIQLAAINFSGNWRECEWTRDVSAIERTLLEYEGDGTVLPTRAVIKLAKQNGRPTLVFIISDAGLYDWQSEMQPLAALMERGHKIIFFLIGGRAADLQKKRFTEFMAQGGCIYCIRNVRNLIGLVVDEIKRAYSPNDGT